MEEMRRKLSRCESLYTIACYTFLASIGVLYLTNITIRVLVYHDTIWELLRDFAAPLAIVSIIYAVECSRGILTTFLFKWLPAVSITAICSPVIAALLSTVSYEMLTETVDINISFFAMLSMCIAPFAFLDVQKSGCLIAAEAILFVLLAVQLGNNVAAMVTIICIAVVLLSTMARLRWFLCDDPNAKQKIYIALMMLTAGVYTVILLKGTGVMDSVLTCCYGRKSILSSSFVNSECFAMLTNAKWLGRTAIEYPMDNIFDHRVFTHILGLAGWAGVIPVLLASALMITSGAVILRRRVGVMCLFATPFLTMITIQTIAYVLMCCGWDWLVFPEVCPFLDGGLCTNTIFILMAAWILPPKPKLAITEEELEEIKAD